MTKLLIDSVPSDPTLTRLRNSAEFVHAETVNAEIRDLNANLLDADSMAKIEERIRRSHDGCALITVGNNSHLAVGLLGHDEVKVACLINPPIADLLSEPMVDELAMGPVGGSPHEHAIATALASVDEDLAAAKSESERLLIVIGALERDALPTLARHDQETVREMLRVTKESLASTGAVISVKPWWEGAETAARQGRVVVWWSRHVEVPDGLVLKFNARRYSEVADLAAQLDVTTSRG